MIKMNNYIVYKHQTPSGKVYIGITRQDPKERWKGGWGYYKSVAFYRAILKYGWDNIEHEILAKGLNEEEACGIEQYFIAMYDSANPEYGYNLTHGGEHYRQGDDSRARLSESLKNFYKNNPDARARISEIQRGRPQTESSNKKRSATLKKYYEEHPENKARCGDSFRGKKRSDETKKRMSENSRNAKAVICIETGTIFKSIVEASRNTGVGKSNISCVLIGSSKTAGGYHWKYYNVNEKLEGDEQNGD